MTILVPLLLVLVIGSFLVLRWLKTVWMYDRQVELEFVSAIEREFSLSSSRMLDR